MLLLLLALTALGHGALLLSMRELQATWAFRHAVRAGEAAEAGAWLAIQEGVAPPEDRAPWAPNVLVSGETSDGVRYGAVLRWLDGELFLLEGIGGAGGGWGSEGWGGRGGACSPRLAWGLSRPRRRLERATSSVKRHGRSPGPSWLPPTVGLRPRAPATGKCWTPSFPGEPSRFWEDFRTSRRIPPWREIPSRPWVCFRARSCWKRRQTPSHPGSGSCRGIPSGGARREASHRPFREPRDLSTWTGAGFAGSWWPSATFDLRGRRGCRVWSWWGGT
jgi:hypothetical protein